MGDAHYLFGLSRSDVGLRKRSDSCLHLCMAIGAQQNALRDLGSIFARDQVKPFREMANSLDDGSR